MEQRKAIPLFGSRRPSRRKSATTNHRLPRRTPDRSRSIRVLGTTAQDPWKKEDSRREDDERVEAFPARMNKYRVQLCLVQLRTKGAKGHRNNGHFSTNRSRSARSSEAKHYMRTKGHAHGTAWAVLFHAAMRVCDQYNLLGGKESYV